jgi:ATP synthase assembly factor FMC1
MLHALRASFRPAPAQASPAAAAAAASSSSTTTTTMPTTKADPALARELASYLAAQRRYVGLVERYNPGMGMDEEERVRLTARRVGMDLPVEFIDVSRRS